MRKPWTDDERDTLRLRYPIERTEDIARDLGRSYQSVSSQAGLMGLRKTPEFMSAIAQVMSARAMAAGAKSQFKKGHVPWSAGKKGWKAGGRSAETRFKPGQPSRNWKPIGTEVKTEDGYWKRKVADDKTPGMGRRNWKFVHVLVWEEAHGPVPAGHCVWFKDGNRENTSLDNLELISRAEVARRNSIHRYGPEVESAIRLVGSVRRQITKREQA